MNLAICAIIRDEREDYLKEWINYHLAIGVDFIHFYDNNSKIPVQPSNRVLVTPFPCIDRCRQMIAYDDFISRLKGKVKWTAFIDPDEFIVIRNSPHRLDTFLENYENYGGVGLNWLIYGSSGVIDNASGSQIHAFTKRSNYTAAINNHIKTITQLEHVLCAVEGHSYRYLNGQYCVNEKYQRVDGAFSPFSCEQAYINHYTIRSKDDYAAKIEKGVVWGDPLVYNWKKFNFNEAFCNEIEDKTLIEIHNHLNPPSVRQ